MRNILIATLALLGLGLALAQTPDDYTLLCDGDVIGAASYVDGELHVALEADVECGGELTVAQDDTLVVTIETVDGATTVTIEPAEDGEGETLSGTAEHLPAEAIDGMVTAQENRAMAEQNRSEAETTAEEARAAADEAGASDEMGAPDDAGAPDELPGPPETPGEPEDADAAGDDARPEGVGEGRP